MATIFPTSCDSPHDRRSLFPPGTAENHRMPPRGPYDRRVTDFVPPPLSPAQQDLVVLLGATVEERPVFDAELRHELRAELEAGLADVATEIDPRQPPAGSPKHTLTMGARVRGP